MVAVLAVAAALLYLRGAQVSADFDRHVDAAIIAMSCALQGEESQRASRLAQACDEARRAARSPRAVVDPFAAYVLIQCERLADARATEPTVVNGAVPTAAGQAYAAMAAGQWERAQAAAELAASSSPEEMRLLRQLLAGLRAADCP